MWFDSGAIAGVGAGATWQQFDNLPRARAWKTVQTQPFALDFVIMGDNNSADNDDHVVSTDATIWSSLQGEVSREWAFSVYGDGLVWAAQKSGDRSYSINNTSDLQDWGGVSFIEQGGQPVEIQELLWDGTQIIIIGEQGDTATIFAGVDATPSPWPKTSINAINDYSPRGIDFNGSTTYIIVGHDSGGTPTNKLYRQQGGLLDSWEEITVPTSLRWAQVKYGNGRWVAFAYASSIIAISSDDGDTWTLASLPVAFPDGGGLGIASAKAAFGFDRFHYYAGSRVYTSSDGLSWARSDTSFGFINVTDWAFSENIAIATGTRSSGNHTSYLKYTEVG